MAALIDAIDVKRKVSFELDGTPFHCLDVEVKHSYRPWRTDADPPEDA